MIDKDYWYHRKEKRFLHNIDTFYYSVKLYNDLTRESAEREVARFRRLVDRYQRTHADRMPFSEVPYQYSMGVSPDSPGGSSCVNYRHGTYGYFYSFILEVPGRFDIAFAPIVRPAVSVPSPPRLL